MSRLDILYNNYCGCYVGILKLTCPLSKDIEPCQGRFNNYKMRLWVRKVRSEVCYVMLGSECQSLCQEDWRAARHKGEEITTGNKLSHAN